jgi:hypothetical protein
MPLSKRKKKKYIKINDDGTFVLPNDNVISKIRRLQGRIKELEPALLKDIENTRVIKGFIKHEAIISKYAFAHLAYIQAAIYELINPEFEGLISTREKDRNSYRVVEDIVYCRHRCERAYFFRDPSMDEFLNYCGGVQLIGFRERDYSQKIDCIQREFQALQLAKQIISNNEEDGYDRGQLFAVLADREEQDNLKLAMEGTGWVNIMSMSNSNYTPKWHKRVHLMAFDRTNPKTILFLKERLFNLRFYIPPMVLMGLKTSSNTCSCNKVSKVFKTELT